MANIIDKKINPEIPIVQESNRNEVYLPRASYTNTGTAGFYKTHFIVDDNGIVHLRKAPERAVSAITYDSNTNTLIITFDDETVETIKLNDCGCVDGTDILVYDAFKVINFKETSWYDTSTNKVLIISAAETGYDNDELVCQLDKYNVINTNVNDNVVTSNYQSNYEYQIYKCTDGSIAIFANTAFAGRFIILKREFAVQKNVANITYDDTTGVLTVYYVTGDKKNILIDRAVVDVDFPNGNFTDVQCNTDDGISLTGTAKITYKDGSESKATIVFDIPLKPADDTIVMDSADGIPWVLIKALKGLKALSATANGGLECTLYDDTKLQTGPFVTIAQEEGNSKEQVMSQDAVTKSLAKKPAGGIGVEIGAGSPSSTTQGTLTQTQLETLQSNEDNYVMFQHEKYYLNDKGHTEGYLTYTHTGYENNTYWIKSITITISTLAWVLNKGGFAGNGLEFDSSDKLQAKLGTGLYFGTDGSINASATDNPYSNTSEEETGLTGLSASTTLDNIISLVRSNRTKVLWNELGPSPNGTQLIRLFSLPEGVSNSTYNKIYFKMAADTTYNPPNQVVIDVYLTTEDAYTNVGCYKGVLFSRVAGAAKWTGWVRVTNIVEHPVPLYVGEAISGDDAYYSVISFDSHNNDLIFRANYGGIDVKLSELARKSEIPSSGTYYRHTVRLYNNETFNEANNVVFFELISTSMVAIDSTQDLTTYAVGSHTCTGFIGSIGTTYGPPVSIIIAATGAPKIYFADASTNFSTMLSGTAINLGLTHIADIVANV